MSHRRQRAAEEQLTAALSKFVPEEHIEAVVDAVRELAAAEAEDRSDSDNRRGEYDPDY